MKQSHLYVFTFQNVWHIQSTTLLISVADPRVSGANTMSPYLPITLLLLVLLNQSAFRILSLSQSEKRQSSMSQSESSSDKINQSETRSDSFSQSETKSIIEMSLDLWYLICQRRVNVMNVDISVNINKVLWYVYSSLLINYHHQGIL